VLVEEVSAPKNMEPVSWKLITNLPIDIPEHVAAIVDAYRGRWVIEEFFKAIKTGCAFEKRQLETLRALLNALAIFSVIAWRLLVLRHVARTSPDAPAVEALTPRQVRLLQRLTTMKGPGVPAVKMSANPTATDHGRPAHSREARRAHYEQRRARTASARPRLRVVAAHGTRMARGAGRTWLDGRWSSVPSHRQPPESLRLDCVPLVSRQAREASAHIGSRVDGRAAQPEAQVPSVCALRAAHLPLPLSDLS
jgi:hypothetical protein